MAKPQHEDIKNTSEIYPLLQRRIRVDIRKKIRKKEWMWHRGCGLGSLPSLMILWFCDLQV